ATAADASELERGAVAHLAVMRAPRRGRSRHLDRGDDVARLQHSLMLRRIAGEQMKLLERDAALAVRAVHDHDGVERNQRHGEIGGVRGDAMVAAAEHGMEAVLALERGAAAARLALVA